MWVDICKIHFGFVIMSMSFHRDEWKDLKANLHDFDDLLVNDAEIDFLKSLSVDNEKVFVER